MKKRLAVLAVVLFSAVSVLYSQTEILAASDPMRLFISGNIEDKAQAVLSCPEEDAQTLALMAVDFVLDYESVLSGDERMEALALTGISRLSAVPAEEGVPRLEKLFRVFAGDTIRAEILKKLTSYAQADLTAALPVAALINAFLAESLKPGAVLGNAQMAAIDFLKTAESKTSFSILFAYVLKAPNAQLAASAKDALQALLPVSMQEIIRILTMKPPAEKLLIFQLVLQDGGLPDSFKAEIAENALAKTIYDTEDISWVEPGLIELHLAALELLADLSWTKAAPSAIRFFTLAQKEYENGLLNDREFIAVIRQIVKVSPDLAAPALASYLNILNEETETHGFRSAPVTIAVINALGGLGDKSAFDYLLYVTYLDYPEEVVDAARSALANLKW